MKSFKTKNHALFVITLLLGLASCAHNETKKPISHANGKDQYWNDLANNSAEEKVSILRVIEENNPALYSLIRKESQDPYLPMYWGLSLNYDSGAKKQIVDEKIVEDLQSVFNIKNDNKIVHAGIMHTYAYLFSTIETPYGYKRQRWISPEVNIAFGFKSNPLSPESSQGGMLTNVTYFAGSIAFKNKTDLSLLKNVSNEVFTYDYSKLKIDRLEEHLKDFTIVTSLVAFPTNEPGNNDYLLIYSVVNKLLNNEQLITVFPITQSSYEGIVDAKQLGQNKKIQVRYNAYLGELEQNLTGTRKIIKNK